MQERNGFISTSIVYSFFLVFILLMIALLMSTVNKRYLIQKVKENLEIPPDEIKFVPECLGGEDSLKDCVFKMQRLKEGISEKGIYAIQNAIRNKTVDLTVPSGENESGMYAAPDNDFSKISQDGIYSYYYRGDVKNNYVVFSNFVWQIVRINGDGSIRMIYKGKYNSSGISSKVSGVDYIDTVTIGTEVLNVGKKDGISFNVDDSAHETIAAAQENILTYCKTGGVQFTCDASKVNFENYLTLTGSTVLKKVGYMNSNTGNVGFYNDKYANAEDSSIKKIVDLWYENNIQNNSDYLKANALFCGDKTRVCKIDSIFCDDVVDESKSDQYYFLAINRININNPSFICGDSGQNFKNSEEYENGFIDRNLSRYSVDKLGKNFNSNELCFGSQCVDAEYSSLFKKVSGFIGLNGDLFYPIALISADELIYSGAVYGTGSSSFLAGNTGDSAYWTMTASYYDSITGGTTDSSKKQGTFYYAMNNYGEVITLNDKYNVAFVRPVINLKEDILYCSGDGTESNPYIIGSGSC